MPAPAAASPAPAHGVSGIEPRHLNAAHWIAALPDADRVLLDESAIARQNARLVELDPSVHDLEALPATLSRRTVRAWLDAYTLPDRALHDAQGATVPAAALAADLDNAAIDQVPRRQRLRHGLVTRRADLRSFPTRRRVFQAPDDTDIDRFQETALFPGTPVVVLHESRDRDWWFVLSPRYAAWIEKQYVALGEAQTVFDYGRRAPFLVVTGAAVQTVFTPERPQVSRLRLDMGVRLPLRSDWPPDEAVNGQHPYASHVVDLPQRDAHGRLELVPALLPLGAEVRRGWLPLTPGNVLRQGFRFLGERYGWGHDYGGRDCSGFVSEVYRSFGVELPRNTGDQARSDAFDRIVLGAGDTRERRLDVIRNLEVGDLVFIPGHVMMVIGRESGLTFVIHDTVGINLRTEGGLRRVKLNSVAVTPLEPLMADPTHDVIDRIHSIQRLRPPAEEKNP